MSARLRAVGNGARPAVEVSGLTKTYPGGVEAVRGIDFQVAPGEVFGLLGPNGAGKSTTIGRLTTTIEPTSGSARLAGFDVVRHPLAARSVSSVVFQESVLDRALSGRRNLDLHARLWGIPPSTAARRVTELASSFGLSEVIGRPAGSYSGGQRRRLEIARALVSEPRVLFLDEPTVGLDTRIRQHVRDRRHRRAAHPAHLHVRRHRRDRRPDGRGPPRTARGSDLAQPDRARQYGRRHRGQLLQVTVLIVAGWLRGSHFHITVPGAGWLAAVARALPTTHTLALLRYGVLGHGGTGLHDIWGIGNSTADAGLSLLVLAGWAVLATSASIRVFKRSAVH